MHQSKEEIEQELKLIEAARNNPDAFAPLYEKYYKIIFLFVYRRTSNESLTADLTQRVFLSAMINLKRYAFTGVPFSAWLFRMALNEISSYYRKNGTQRTATAELDEIKNIFDETHNDTTEEAFELLLQALNKLNQDELQLVELRFFEQRTFAEIGSILNITENNAKVRLYRIIDKLKKILQAR